MRRRPPAGAVWAVSAVCGGLLVGALWLTVRNGGIWSIPADLRPGLLNTIPLALGFGAVGALIAVRRPGHRLGWLYLGIGVAATLVLFCYPYAYYGLIGHPGSLPLAVFAGWVSGWIWTLSLTPALTFGLLLYPDGRLPSPRWRWAGAVSAGAIVLPALAFALMPGPLVNHHVLANPVGLAGAGRVLTSVATLGQGLFTVALAAGMVSLVVRWRRAAPGSDARRQVSLLVVAGLVAPLAYPLSSGTGLAAVVAAGVLTAFVPAAIGVAVLRRGLYEIDPILNRTLVYGALTIAIVAAYGAIIGGFGLLVHHTPESVAILAPAAAAVLVMPLRNRLQRLVDSMMYGDRGDPNAAVSKLAARLDTAVAPGEALAAIVHAVAGALRLPFVAIETSLDGRPATVATGHPAGTPTRIPLTRHGEAVGTLLVEGRDHHHLDARDRALLVDLARQAGAAVHAASLADDLQHSRERLVTTREEERRRLRRDLHDGLGPALAGIGLGLDIAGDRIATDPADATRMLAELKAETSTSIADIRRIVYDLRPPALDEFGLISALRHHADRLMRRDGHLSIELDMPDDVPKLSAATEVAAYRIAVEALTNTARHAAAGHCRLRLRVGDQLHLEVVDDGRGLAIDATAGVGMAVMRERASELGGSCAIRSTLGGGTTVDARLPVGPP